jgi:hypothetical protein
MKPLLHEAQCMVGIWSGIGSWSAWAARHFSGRRSAAHKEVRVESLEPLPSPPPELSLSAYVRLRTGSPMSARTSRHPTRPG